jgi:hypothetical protein
MSSSVASIAQWQEQVARLLPGLSKPEANVLGLLSYAMILTRGSGLTRLSSWLAQVEQVPAGRLRQRLREFYYEAKAKRGKKRREVQVEKCFAELLRGMLRGWQGRKELVLALDASALGERFVTLNLSVVYRGCGIPVAWTILRANQTEGWKAHWLRLLQAVAGVIPADWRVLVMADRGLYAPWLYRAIQANGWHPFLRVKENLTFRAPGELAFRPIRERLARRGRQWQGRGQWSEQGETIAGTLLIGWEHGYEHRMAVVTDLAVEEAQVAWYQMRFWIEDEYKDHKRGAFHWEHTKMSDPRRAERLYLVMAVAMQAAVLLGGALEAREQQHRQQNRGGKHRKRRRVGRPARPWRKPREREQSCLERGCQAISAAAVRGDKVPVGQIVADSWPSQLYPVGKLPSSWVRKRKHKEATRRQRQSKQAEQRRQALLEQSAQKRAEQALRRQERQERRASREAEQRQQRKAQRDQRQQAKEQRCRVQEEKRTQRQQEEAERKPEQERKRARRQLARQEREQEREWRARWHEEIRQDRARRKFRQQQRTACSRAASSIFPPQEALAPLPQPP